MYKRQPICILLYPQLIIQSKLFCLKFESLENLPRGKSVFVTLYILFEVDSHLEDSLAHALLVLDLVKSSSPQVITIQCLITEESLNYLLFNKLPGIYKTMFTKSFNSTNIGSHSSISSFHQTNPLLFSCIFRVNVTSVGIGNHH